MPEDVEFIPERLFPIRHAYKPHLHNREAVLTLERISISPAACAVLDLRQNHPPWVAASVMPRWCHSQRRDFNRLAAQPRTLGAENRTPPLGGCDFLHWRSRAKPSARRFGAGGKEMAPSSV